MNAYETKLILGFRLCSSGCPYWHLRVVLGYGPHPVVLHRLPREGDARAYSM